MKTNANTTMTMNEKIGHAMNALDLAMRAYLIRSTDENAAKLRAARTALNNP